MTKRTNHNENYKWVKIAIWGLLIIITIETLMIFYPENNIEVSVKPTHNFRLHDSAMASYKNVEVKYSGTVFVKNATIWQRCILPTRELDSHFFRNLLFILIGILILRALPHAKDEQLFKKDISGTIKAVGGLLMLYSLIETLQNNLADRIVKEMTDYEFQLLFERSTYSLPIIFGAAIIWLGVIFKKAYSLKQEQDLTI